MIPVFWKRNISHIFAILSIILISGFCISSLAKPGLPKLHDSNPHISRAIAYHTALLDGQLPPMWAKEVLGGIGSPVMMLNYQLPYVLGEIWYRLGFTYFDSYKLNLGLSLIVSGVAMYLSLTTKFGPMAAWLGAMIYTLAPYRFVDIYVRGALGESLTFVFPPLLIWGFTTSNLPILILGWSGLFLTHPLASAAFSAFFLGYVFFVGKKEDIAMRLKLFFGSFGVALLIAAFNLLPTLTLTKYTYYSPSLSGTLTMFPNLIQLFHSAWGYGVSVPGPSDGMSFELGFAQWVVLFLGLMTMFRHKSKELKYLLFTCMACLYFILPISMPIYKLTHLTSIIDFPWRLLFCLIFASAWVGAILSDKLKVKRDKWILTTVIITCLIAQSWPIAHTNNSYWHKSAEWFARETGDSYGEYAPLTRSTRDSAPFWLRAEFVTGTGSIDTQVEKSNLQRYLIRTETGGEIRINTAYFPGWIIPSNCHVTTRTLSHIDDSGLIGCDVPIGESILEIKFEAPTVQKLGNLITLAGIGIYLWILLASFYQHITKLRR